MQKLLTTKEVAKVLQSSESSVKRWCDQGALKSVRTPGGHRRVSMASVLEFARDKGKIEPAAAILGIPATNEALKKASSSHAPLVEAFMADDEKGAEAVILSAFASGMSIDAIADQLITPAMIELGSGWQEGKVEIHQERRAIGMIEQALARISSSLPPAASDAPLAVGATVENDHFTLASRLASLTLQQNGWNAKLLGSNIPLQSIVQAVKEWQADLLWLSFSFVEAEDALVQQYNQLVQPLIEQGVSVVVGGRCTNMPFRNKLAYTFYGKSMQSLASFSSGAPRRLKVSVGS